MPPACPACASPYLEQAGFGTERVEAEIRRCCPGARVERLDRDAIRRKGALTSVLARFRAGEIDVLVGTQMIAKGHDFPDVTLVGVISADVGLGLADFRSNERTFQLLTQVAGRAGRGERRGEAIIQSLLPAHYAITLACTQDYRAFYDTEIKYRRTMRNPPQVAIVGFGKVGVHPAAQYPAFPWSGQYRQTGGAFWFIYEYAFQPLTATLFGLLAFYVSAAAFRAFRAKNVEAALLLGTAFIVLLGRTFAGVALTSWIDPDVWSGFRYFTGLRLENLTVYIMSVFNTVGNRAIMIGIALGIVATSLKILLGIDRPYLGKD